MWTIRYRSRYGVDEMVVEAETRELAEEEFILDRIEAEEFGVILRIEPFEGSPTVVA
jgi:hypothetical protein